MSRTFQGIASELLTSGVLSADQSMPYTMFCWARATSFASSRYAISLCDDPAGANRTTGVRSGTAAGNPWNLEVRQGATTDLDHTVTYNDIGDNVWFHFGFTIHSLTDIEIFINGTGVRDNAVSLPEMVAKTVFVGARRPDASQWVGEVAEVGVVTRALTAGEWSGLVAKTNPLDVLPTDGSFTAYYIHEHSAEGADLSNLAHSPATNWGNLSGNAVFSASNPGVSAPSGGAPSLSYGAITNTDTTADVDVSYLNEDSPTSNKESWATCQISSAPAPSVSQIQSGNDGNGTAAAWNGGFVSHGSVSGVVRSLAATGLSPDTEYQFYTYMSEGGGASAGPTASLAFTTDAAASITVDLDALSNGSVASKSVNYYAWTEAEWNAAAAPSISDTAVTDANGVFTFTVAAAGNHWVAVWDGSSPREYSIGEIVAA